MSSSGDYRLPDADRRRPTRERAPSPALPPHPPRPGFRRARRRFAA
ncbi:hypothetical protein BMA10247_A1024 [Burkholderia mallei NCTC 10247]|nr:hypothetical protein BMASAVP1_0271 [Burkholderia mallei SAVP1]ABO02757.1 hypothetical protein BMA10247_A1024 [Burkholderia mallei NCTC 10247]EDK55440.1 hypothetical protein BMAFMH_E0499 [Burkholderia mallei FMH]